MIIYRVNQVLPEIIYIIPTFATISIILNSSIIILGNSYVVYIPVIETRLVFLLTRLNIDFKFRSIYSVPVLVPEFISVGITTTGYYNTGFTITDFQLLIP